MYKCVVLEHLQCGLLSSEEYSHISSCKLLDPYDLRNDMKLTM